jgi:hypothetical protein
MMTRYGNACSFYDTVTIGNPVTHNLNAVVTPSGCSNSAGGSVILNPAGGPYTFLWRDLPDENGYSSRVQNQSDLYPGIYEVEVTDTNGCVSVHSFTVGSNGGPVLVSPAAVTAVTGCPSSSNGSATVQITGGTAPYNQDWIDNNMQHYASGTQLSAGSYRVIATDQSGCTGYTFVHVPSSHPPLHYELLDSSVTQTTCDSSNDGRLFACIHGGLTPYTIDQPWTISSNIASAENLAPGLYPLTITDGAGCIFSDTLRVDSTHLQLSLTPLPTHCTGCQDGLILLNYSGGIQPYNITWMPSAGQLADTAIVNLAAGFYTVCLTDSNNCIVCYNTEVLDDPLSVNRAGGAGRIRIFPNPATRSVLITDNRNSGENLRLRMEDIYGKRTDFVFTGSGSVDLTNLSAGVYNFSVYDNQERISSERIIIIK